MNDYNFTTPVRVIVPFSCLNTNILDLHRIISGGKEPEAPSIDLLALDLHRGLIALKKRGTNNKAPSISLSQVASGTSTLAFSFMCMCVYLQL